MGIGWITCEKSVFILTSYCYISQIGKLELHYLAVITATCDILFYFQIDLMPLILQLPVKFCFPDRSAY